MVKKVRAVCITLVCLFVSVAPCLAHLGETIQQIESRYGQPINRNIGDATERSFSNSYRRPGFPKDTITVTFLDGISQSEAYERDAPEISYRNHGHFSDEDSAIILAANARNQVWHRLKGDESEGVEWRLGSDDFDSATAQATRVERWQQFDVETTAFRRWRMAAAAVDRSAAAPSPSLVTPKAEAVRTDQLVARGVFPIAASEAVYDRMNSYLTNGDLNALAQLQQAGLIAFLKPGTAVRIVESRGFILHSKERIQIVGTTAEVWARPDEIVYGTELPARKARAVSKDGKRAR